jgi:CubicO group peptidase (beta-lactamase class C family)
MPDLLTADGLRRFDAVAAAHVAEDKVPGLVALVARGDQAHVAALGSLSAGGAPVQRDSIFRIASVTKLVTGAATLALAREGLLALDEPVDRLLPELASRRVLRRMDGPLEVQVWAVLAPGGTVAAGSWMAAGARPGRCPRPPPPGCATPCCGMPPACRPASS